MPQVRIKLDSNPFSTVICQQNEKNGEISMFLAPRFLKVPNVVPRNSMILHLAIAQVA